MERMAQCWWMSLWVMSLLGLEAAADRYITATACPSSPDNATSWTVVSQLLDGQQAANLVLMHHSPAEMSTVNCPGAAADCHAWAPGFGDRNGVLLLDGQLNSSFRIQSWPLTKSLPVGPNQTPPGQCLSSSSGANPPTPGSRLAMLPCSEHSLNFKLNADGTVQIDPSPVPHATRLCLGAPVPPPLPPPGRPLHYWSCTANLAGGERLGFEFCNASLPMEQRLDNLVSLASCQEKAAALTSSGAAIPRLGVPALGSAEDTHGVGGACLPAAQAANGSTGCPTTFPAGPGLGASFDRELWRQIGSTIGTEARALNNLQVGPLYFLDPDINLLRDPRWGRAQEVPGECPYLTGEYGSYIIQGTQEGGLDPRYLQAASTMKHFQVYDLEGYQPNANSSGIPADAKCDAGGAECGRGTFDASPPPRDFVGYYMQAFKTVAQRAAPAATMCAYNAIYGVPACASPLNNELLRGEWGWDGVVISDCGAVSMIQGSHQYTQDPNSTMRAALVQGGVDVNCGGGQVFYQQHMCDAVANGSLAAADVDKAARRYWGMMMRLGMLDPMHEQPNLQLGALQVDNPHSRALALQSATESLVLLKNLNALPLDGKQGRVLASKAKLAFIGPLANATQDLLSAPQYHGTNLLVNSHSPLQLAQARGWQVSYERGCNICDIVPLGYPNQPCSVGTDGKSGPQPPPDTSMIPAAAAAAQAADVAVLFLGADQTTEAENFDRRELGLVGAQEQLLQAVTAVQKNVLVVLIHGGPIAIEAAAESSAVRAIIDAFQPGELGGDAIIDVLSGASAPSGLMPYSTYLANYTSRDIREVDLRAARGTTYWWHTDPVLYPFGWGLSYTNFSFAWSEPPLRRLQIPSSRAALSSLQTSFSVTVTNNGTVSSDVVVLAFVAATHTSGPDTPLKKLFGFERLAAVKPGESRTVQFFASSADLGVVGADGVKVLHPGGYKILCGSVANSLVHDLDLVGAMTVL